ncbi:MAG: hypothetical protein ABI182_08275 [Candidatus Baltobacteraceae bacterium]
MLAQAALALILGVPVLLTGTPASQTRMHASLIARPTRQPLTVDLNAVETDGSRTIRGYDWDMTKKLHMIVISDDLRSFMHVHPVLGADGHFRLRLRFPNPALYHIYIDGIAHSLGRQIFRFDVDVDSSAKPLTHRSIPSSAPVSDAGPYRVRIDKSHLIAGEQTLITVNVSKNGKPAVDLRPYLGAMGHGVFIGAADLSYVHVHAMDAMMMDMMGTDDCGDAIMTMNPIPPDSAVPATLQFYLKAPVAGSYRLWFQFGGPSRDYAAAFTIVAR